MPCDFPKKYDTLETVMEQGVLVYHEDKLITKEEAGWLQWAGETGEYLPQFVVRDEEGNLTEIWYGDDRNDLLSE